MSTTTTVPAVADEFPMDEFELEDTKPALSLVTDGEEQPDEIALLLERMTAFHINNRERADWLLRKLKECDLRTANAAAYAQREAEQAEKDKMRLRARFESELREFAKAEIAAQKGKAKSLKLAFGTIGFRSQKPLLVIEDEAKLKAWAANECPVAVRSTFTAQLTLKDATVLKTFRELLAKAGLTGIVAEKVEVMKTPLNEITKAGITPEGCELKEREDEFYIA